MEHSNENENPQGHVETIFKEYTTPSRVLRSFTNLSNTVIQTALSGQSKFVFEILQNADDAFEDQDKAIEIKFILQEDYLIVQHNGKGFDYNDVERICDYASQIEEVKATDLSKTGYKGLGFKSLFNLSDCICIHSNGYSFRFDKSYWPDSDCKPWQVIPIWSRYDELPLTDKYLYDQPVNFILKVNDANQLERQLEEVVDQPELLLYLHRIDKFSVELNDKKYVLERNIVKFGLFDKICFTKNGIVESIWLSRNYKRSVPEAVQKFVGGASKFIFPDKIKNAKEVPLSFTLRWDEKLKKIIKVRGLCFSTVPMQLHLTLPYHINSFFILNLDRTQLHENEWNEFLINQIGYLQLNFLKDLASLDYLKNYVIELLVREVNHGYKTFSQAFLKGFTKAKAEIRWLPSYQGPHLLRLGEAWRDDIDFFKQNFQNIQDLNICPRLIHYDVKSQYLLSSDKGEVNLFSYEQLFKDFPTKYYPQLTQSSYISFIDYLYEKTKNQSWNSKVISELENLTFLVSRNKILLAPQNALLEEKDNPIPDFLMLNPVDNEYLPKKTLQLIKIWLNRLGAKWLFSEVEILRESVLRWLKKGEFYLRISEKNHIEIINYLARGTKSFTGQETDSLRENLLILTKSNDFKLANSCYFSDAFSVKELADTISDDETVSPSYNTDRLKEFFIQVGVQHKTKPMDVFKKSILPWIKDGKIKKKLTVKNYNPIIEFLASEYPLVEDKLTESEIKGLRKMPVLTSGQVFEEAHNCYFDSAIPNIKGFECIIPKVKLILTESISPKIFEFLSKIGVSEKIDPINVMRKSVLRWIQNGETTMRITWNNHQDILGYMAERWISLNKSSGLTPEEKKELTTIPILTESNNFKVANSCFWPTTGDDEYDDIPGIEFIISSDELVSSEYSKEIKFLLRDLGVRNIKFINIYEKYYMHLTCKENVRWFFTQLVNHWRRNKDSKKDDLIMFLREKFKNSSFLLAKNGQTYLSTELYSSCLNFFHEIDPKSVPLLDFEKLPEDLENYLGFRSGLDLNCIFELLKTYDKHSKLGEERTRIFFTTLLEQLRKLNRKEIRKYPLSLLSRENDLRHAKNLYYFIEESASCYLKESYLKRIPGMSHAETLELAELCGVNILPFKEEIKREKEIADFTLKEFYLKRLPFIVIQESRELNEDPSVILKRLYDQICLIKLYKCSSILVQYQFGNPVKIYLHLDNLTIYVTGKWNNKKTRIHCHLKEVLCINTDIRDIIDMEEITDIEMDEWFCEQKENPEKFYSIQKELEKLICNKM